MSDIQWQKSSYSADGPGNNCVELARTPDSILLRESDEPHAVITTTPAALRALTHAVKAGRFDHVSR
ncbi:hypothetical protein SBI_07229 [Streptomyces bingchenggensis BCW-1]|uniref:DUF397 domain-containing protein n=1 Tax=Streptomyces bingchenggensis (strain BCW-1) TaxID=749414 RepID=D7C5G1_STRBB|nr:MULTISPECIES: DUF397 domain-containing protein [Streptomyces]ADI10349.1 hypothetical protein SBI_07229 [Streptomyces bingchenggensis BCW-1]